MNDDRKLVHLGNNGQGVNRQLVHLGDNGQGVNTGYYCLVEQGDATISQYVTGGAVCEIEFMVTYKARI